MRSGAIRLVNQAKRLTYQEMALARAFCFFVF